MKVALHAGQLLQPVPGGIGRYDALARCGVCPTVGVEPIAFAAGARPPGVAAPRRRGSTSAPPHGSVRYELLAPAAAARRCASTPTSCTRRASRSRPVRDAALVVTVHDIAFLRVPARHDAARASASTAARSHVAREHADLVHRAVVVHPRRAEPRGLQPEDVQVAPFGVDPPLAARPTTRSTPRSRASGVDAPVRAHGRHRRAAQGPRDDRRRGRAHPATRHADLTARRRRTAGLGRGRAARPAVRARARRAAVVGPRRALPRASAACLPRVAVRRLRAARRSRRWRAACRSRSPKARRSRRSSATPALLFAPGDVEACADALERLLDDDELRAELAARGPGARGRAHAGRARPKAHAAAYERAVALRARNA